MRLEFLEDGDRRFLAQVTNAEIRRLEITRLLRIRRNFFLVGVLMLVLALAETLIQKAGGSFYFWIVFLLEGFGFYDAQYKLRMLQLAEQMNSEKTGLRESGKE